MSDEPEQRHSRAHDAVLIDDARARAEAEARQYDLAVRMIQHALEAGSFRLRLSTILSLHREALAGISAFAGNFRPAGVAIEGSKHTRPGAHLVPELVEGMCDYVNDRWQDSTAIHLAS